MRRVLCFLWILGGCGGGSTEPDPPEAEAAAQEEEEAVETPDEEPSRPKLDCPDGATQADAPLPEGHEHFCEKLGARDGPYLRLYADGQRAIEGTYVRDQPDGTWSWFHPSGEKAQKGLYRNGRQIGTWTRWYVHGEIEEIGDYIQGRKSGQWTWNYPNGRVKTEGMYQNDMKQGPWRYFRDADEDALERTELWEVDQLKSTREAASK